MSNKITLFICCLACILFTFSNKKSLAGKGFAINTVHSGDIVINPRMLIENIDDLNKPLRIGSAQNPLLLGAQMTSPDRLFIDFFAASGTDIYISADPKEGIASIESLDLCAREDMICESKGTAKNKYPKAHLRCENGVWSKIDVSGTCFVKAGCCYPSRDKLGCVSLTASSQIGIEPYSDFDNELPETGLKCHESGNFKPADKQYCVIHTKKENFNVKHHKTGASSDASFYGGISGETGDDMFRIKSGAHAILVYNRSDVPEEYRAIKIKDTRTGGSDFMLPAGPAKTYEDWISFIENPPKGLEIERISSFDPGTVIPGSSCPPVAISLCGLNVGQSIPKPPVVDAECGFADDTDPYDPTPEYSGPTGEGYETLVGIDKEGLCIFGDPVFPATQDAPDYLLWNCAPPPIISGGNIVSCKTPRYTPPPPEDPDA